VTYAVGRELRGVRLMTGGPGVIILTTRRGRLLSGGACRALERAALRLGYRARGKHDWWTAVVRAVDDNALDEVLTEAIEEQEARPEDAPAGQPGPGNGARP
jgi:hypothetical protein